MDERSRILTLTNEDRDQILALWRLALAEDGFPEDVTSQVAIAADARGCAEIVVREAGVFAGEMLFETMAADEDLDIQAGLFVSDGDRLAAGARVAELHGSLRTLLGIERTLLNFLQRLCGVATLTCRFVEAVADTGAEIYDTRKTIPGWRALDKYAVRCGGGKNHRRGLHDAVLVKDNHVSGLGSAELASGAFEMLNRLSEVGARPEFVEFEVDTPGQLDALFKVVGIEVILLDNFTPEQMREAVARRDALGLRGKVALEASGNVNLDTVRQVAETGVERIAIGALTHSAKALDIGMDLRGRE